MYKSIGDKIGIPDGWQIGDAVTVLPQGRYASTSPILSEVPLIIFLHLLIDSTEVHVHVLHIHVCT